MTTAANTMIDPGQAPPRTGAPPIFRARGLTKVYGEGAAAWAQHHGSRLAQRCEVSGETVFCYAEDASPLIAELGTQPDLRYLHRHANLEDVLPIGKAAKALIRSVARVHARSRATRSSRVVPGVTSSATKCIRSWAGVMIPA